MMDDWKLIQDNLAAGLYGDYQMLRRQVGAELSAAYPDQGISSSDYNHVLYGKVKSGELQPVGQLSSRPIRFQGSEQERRDNRRTHSWDMSDPDTRCFSCDCRPSYAAADYPCGADVPRETVVIPR
jgi:hypothetical protein